MMSEPPVHRSQAIASRFVILRHEMPENAGRESHYDLMIEQLGVLLTWAIGQLPNGQTPLSAVKLPDHRLAYLTFEGDISGDRGHVRRVDEGGCVVLNQAADWLEIKLQGAVHAGKISLEKTHVDEEGQEIWRLTGPK